MEVVSGIGIGYDLFMKTAEGLEGFYKIFWTRRERVFISPVQHSDKEFSADIIVQRLHLGATEFRVRVFTTKDLSQPETMKALVASDIIQLVLSWILEDKTIGSGKLQTWSVLIQNHLGHNNRKNFVNCVFKDTGSLCSLDVTLNPEAENHYFSGVVADGAAAADKEPAYRSTIAGMLKKYAHPAPARLNLTQ